MTIITLPKPPSVNHLYKISCRGGYPRFYKSEEGKAWIEEAGWKLKSQWRKRKTITNNVSLYVKFYYCGKADIDNPIKALLDLLMEMKVIEDDGQVEFLQIEKVKVKNRSKEKVEIEII